MRVKYYVYFGLLLLIGILGIQTIPVKASLHTSVSLDDARIFNSLSTLKRYLAVLHNDHIETLKLHISDDQQFSIYNPLLRQDHKHQQTKRGIAYNQYTKRPFLNQDQFKDLVATAKAQHVKLVLEMDVPSHVKALIKLLKYVHYPKLNQLSSNGDLNYGDQRTIDLVEQLWTPYLAVLPSGSTVSIGGDEFSSGSEKDRDDYVRFVNTLNQFFNARGFHMQMYNDGLFQPLADLYDHTILIDYWSQTGDTTNAKDLAYNKTYRATLNQAVDDGFNVIDANGKQFYALFNSNRDNNVSDLKNQFKIWQDHHNSKLYGIELSIWGSDTAKSINADKVLATMQKPLANWSNLND